MLEVIPPKKIEKYNYSSDPRDLFWARRQPRCQGCGTLMPGILKDELKDGLCGSCRYWIGRLKENGIKVKVKNENTKK